MQQPKMTQPSFLAEIPKEYILMTNIKGKDKPWGIGKGWSLEEAQHKLNEDRYISCCYYLKDTPYVVVDIDDDSYTLDQLFEDTGIDSTYVVGNTKGFHVWVEIEKGKPDYMKRNIINVGRNATIDFIGEKVFERVGKDWVGNEACYLTEEQFKKCFYDDKVKPKTKKETTQQPFSDTEVLKKMVDLIDVKYCDDRDDWLKIVCAIKK